MKIKLSKSQWQQIGKTAGWISRKSAASFEDFRRDLIGLAKRILILPSAPRSPDANNDVNDAQRYKEVEGLLANAQTIDQPRQIWSTKIDPNMFANLEKQYKSGQPLSA